MLSLLVLTKEAGSKKMTSQLSQLFFLCLGREEGSKDSSVLSLGCVWGGGEGWLQCQVEEKEKLKVVQSKSKSSGRASIAPDFVGPA